MRLIDADALFNWGKHKLSDAVKYGNKDEKHQDFSYSTLMMYEIADEVDDAPTIDVAPVVRGEWLVTDAYPHRVYCSVCYKTNVLNEEWLYEKNDYPKYCMWCGAKMEDKSCG